MNCPIGKVLKGRSLMMRKEGMSFKGVDLNYGQQTLIFEDCTQMDLKLELIYACGLEVVGNK